MFRSISIVVACFVLSVSGAKAQVNIDTGLFINQPGLDNENEFFGIAFRGQVGENGPNLGLSFKAGRFLFGFETLTSNNSFQSETMTSVNSSGEAVSAGFTSSVGPTHRAMMGFKLARNIALYGFHGLAGYSVNNELAYEVNSEVSGTDYRKVEYRYGCGYRGYKWEPYDFTATHSSLGYSSGSFDGLKNSIGAGVEAGLFGGVLRFEYNMMHTSGFTQTAELKHSSTDSRLKNNSDQESYSYHWQGSMEQKLQLRWKTSF